MATIDHATIRRAARRLAGRLAGGGRLLCLTGAGISAESGIPTFRGPGGYWTVGSRVYEPEEMATRAMFARDSGAVWAWYLYRRGVCAAASPNPGHDAVVALERRLGGRFLLVTQNVDGLHRRAGSTAERTREIHGNIHHARCAGGCGLDPWPLPDHLQLADRLPSLPPAIAAELRCPRCGGPARPHVLWFDESYDDRLFHLSEVVAAGHAADVLLVAGTSGATSLPAHLGAIAAQAGALVVDVNPVESPFSRLARGTPGGEHLAGPAAAVLPALAAALDG